MSGRARGRARGHVREQADGGIGPRPGRKPGCKEEPDNGGRASNGRGRARPNNNGSKLPGINAPDHNGARKKQDRDENKTEAGNNVQDGSLASAGGAVVPRPGALGLGDQLARLNLGVGERRRPKPVDMREQMLRLTSNHYRLKSAPSHLFYQYSVAFDPDVEDDSMARGLIHQHRHLFDVKVLAGRVLYTPTKLKAQTTLISERRSDGARINVTITLTSEIHPHTDIWYQLVNIAFRQMQRSMGYVQIGRHYYDPSAENSRVVMCGGTELQLWPGFMTSLLQMEAGLLLCAEISFKVTYRRSVLDVLNEIAMKTRGRDTQDLYRRADQSLAGTTVMTRYNNRTYRVNRVVWDQSPASTFPYKDGKAISFVQYYQQQYGLQITELNQPMLETLPKERDRRRGHTQPALLVPELCYLTGMTEDMRNDMRMQRDLVRHMQQTPGQRQQALHRLRGAIGQGRAAEVIKGWGLQFEENLLEVPGKQLQHEKVYSAGSVPMESEPGEFRRGLQRARALGPVSVQHWVMIAARRNQRDADQLLSMMQQVARTMEIPLAVPQMILVGSDHTRAYLEAIREMNKEQLQYVLCLIPHQTKDRYDPIKTRLTVEHGIPSQVVVAGTLRKGLSAVTGIVVQMQAKLGGEVWAVSIPANLKLMVCGMDVYHEKHQPSVAALIASYNQNLTQYSSACCFLERGQEIVPELTDMMYGCLKYYHDVNRTLPERIVMYRDGVGDGNHQHVLTQEVPQMREAFKRFGEDYQPRLTVITVNKRIHPRFWLQKGGRQENPPPGTVIEEGVTRPGMYDFFLVSQSVRQGTVTPTLYNVLLDEWNLQSQLLQRLTYKLTHLYYNWPGTVRVPAPCQYAHKLAYQVGESLHEIPHADLMGTLFYL